MPQLSQELSQVIVIVAPMPSSTLCKMNSLLMVTIPTLQVLDISVEGPSAGPQTHQPGLFSLLSCTALVVYICSVCNSLHFPILQLLEINVAEEQ